MYKHMLLPVDGREASNQAAEQGLRLAAEVGAGATLLAVDEHRHQVLYPPAEEGSDKGWSPVVGKDLWEDLERRAAPWQRRGLKVKVVIVQGDPAEEILSAAEREQADLIVMAAHCRGPVGTLLLGSVSQAVLRHATCPVQIYGTRNKFVHAAKPELAPTAFAEPAEPPGVV